MILDPKEAELFFKLMGFLQFYVKEQLDMLPKIKSSEAYASAPGMERMKVRNAVWENPGLISDYVHKNPDNLPAEQLAIVAGWQNFLKGKFYIERFLKKYAVFIGENDRVYGVLGLYDPLDEIISKQMLPTLVEAILLPFKEVIIYDGLLSSYPVFFGGGIKGNLKQIYDKAKRKGEILISFDPEVQKAHKAVTKKKLKDWQPTLGSLMQEANSLRAESGSPPTWGPAFSMVKASLALAETAVTNPDDVDALWEQFDKLSQTARRLENAIYRS
ncbi:MAG: hypothetical protein R6X34_11770 [Chloroflexota bacterium]